MLALSLACLNRRDGIVIRASALQSVDRGFISQVESYQKILKMVFTASLLGSQQNRDVVKNKPACLLVSLDKTLNGTTPSLCGRRGDQAIYLSW